MIDVEEILSKMNPNQKINYDRVMQKMVQVWEKNEERPTILMHVCCAPCSTYTLEYLTKYADVTIYSPIPISIPRQNTTSGLTLQKNLSVISMSEQEIRSSI